MNLNRSFSRRIGKSLSQLQKSLLEFDLPSHLYSNATLTKIGHDKSIVLEIGFGMGEHLINQAKLNPDSIFLGADPYLNGVANVLKLAKTHYIDNFLLWPDDLDIVLQDIPDNILEVIYILFPDPWPKNKQHKRRIVNRQRLEILKHKLKIGGLLVFASDIENYFESCKKLILSDRSFNLIDKDFTLPHKDYVITKYHQKSIEENRIAQFLKCYRVDNPNEI